MSFVTMTSGIWTKPPSKTISTPLTEGGASGASPLDIKQRGAVIGEVIPIVFCRRVGDIGGVLISPPATEARFDDDATTADVTASYHLVLSDGDIESIQVRDVFQRSCRVGEFTQTYDRRAGTFVAGNFIDNSPNLEAPYYCGSGGSYAGMSTMAFSVTIPAGFDYWNRQVHCFIRGGALVTRLLDSTLGPSNNVVDLTLYLLQKTSRLNAAQIDTSLLLDAARFTDTNGLWYNGVENQSANLRDWLKGTLDYFLLRSTRVGGKETLRPLLPYIPATGAIDTGPVEWVFTFTEEHIIPGSFQIDYIPLTERKPFCALMLWRQQPTDDIGIIRTSEVRYPGTAADGPFEQYDLSKFCASEDHAWKAGTYIISRRRHITHTLVIRVRPDAFNPTLAAGDIVRVRLDRVASTGAASIHNYLYEVDRISKAIGGEVQLDLTHFPVDDQLRSVVALEVDSAEGGGVLLETGKSGVSCDVNSSTDTTVPDEEFTDDTDIDDGDGSFDGSGESGIPDTAPDNPDDGEDDQQGPYDGWPETYPRPEDPDWPFETTNIEDPGGRGKWIEPMPLAGDDPDAPGVTSWTYTFNPVSWIGYKTSSGTGQCISIVNSGTMPGSTAPVVSSTQKPIALFAEYQMREECAGKYDVIGYRVVQRSVSTGLLSIASAGGGSGGGARVNLNDRILTITTSTT